MLRFERATYAGENAPKSSWGDIYRLVDIRELGGPLGERSAPRLSASFNAASIPVGGVRLQYRNVRSGDGFGCTQRAAEVALDRRKQCVDGTHLAPLKRTQKWQRAHTGIEHSTADPVCVGDIWRWCDGIPVRSEGAVSFKAHYLDDVRLDLIQKPAL